MTAELLLHPHYTKSFLNEAAYKRGYRCGWRDREAMMEPSLARWAFYAEHHPMRKVGFDIAYWVGYRDAALSWGLR